MIRSRKRSAPCGTIPPSDERRVRSRLISSTQFQQDQPPAGKDVELSRPNGVSATSQALVITEILENIFIHVDEGILAVQHVCHQWYTIIRKSPRVGVYKADQSTLITLMAHSKLRQRVGPRINPILRYLRKPYIQVEAAKYDNPGLCYLVRADSSVFASCQPKIDNPRMWRDIPISRPGITRICIAWANAYSCDNKLGTDFRPLASMGPSWLSKESEAAIVARQIENGHVIVNEKGITVGDLCAGIKAFVSGFAHTHKPWTNWYITWRVIADPRSKPFC